MGIKLWKVGDTCWAYDNNSFVVRQFVIVAITDVYYDLKWISRYDHRSHYKANMCAKDLFHTMDEAVDAHMKETRQDLVRRSEQEHSFQSTEEHP